MVIGEKHTGDKEKTRGGEITHVNVCHWRHFPDNRSGARFDKSNVLHITQSATLQPECDSYANYNSLIRQTSQRQNKPRPRWDPRLRKIFFISLLLSNSVLNWAQTDHDPKIRYKRATTREISLLSSDINRI